MVYSHITHIGGKSYEFLKRKEISMATIQSHGKNTFTTKLGVNFFNSDLDIWRHRNSKLHMERTLHSLIIQSALNTDH